MKKRFRLVVLLCLMVLPVLRGYAQPELEPWGNLTGIRIQGQLMDFGTSLRAAFSDGRVLTTAKERQSPHYTWEGRTRIVRTNLDSLFFTETVEDLENGVARVTIECIAHAEMKMEGAFFALDLPGDSLAPSAQTLDSNTLQFEYYRRSLRIRVKEPGVLPELLDSQTRSLHRRLDFPIKAGDWKKGEAAQLTLTVTVSGDIDRAPAHVVVDVAAPGRPFDGVGGNFRIQNTKMDPKVIDYCLQNMRVAWGRVELPWRLWQPAKDADPLEDAKTGHLPAGVQRAMEMAHTLGEKKIPFVLSAWFPPDWAIIGPVRFRPGADHIWGNALNHDQDTAIYKSISDYIVFLKEHYGVEPKYFSFNESDLGINVRQTAQEHDALIKGLGAYFASRGVATRVLLGDNSDATTWPFIGEAMEDPAARRWIGAVSFHSWRGWDTATLEKWANAATKLGLPLLVAEGSIDAAAWNYPDIFREPSYALKEIGLYTRLLAICQPSSILQWQLTSDYSLLAGGGIFGDTGTLRPTQRFYNLQQLSITPPGLFAMHASCDRPNMTVAALGDNKRHLYTLHLVNDAAARDVVLTGLPAEVKTLAIFTTNQVDSSKQGEPVRVKNGQARFTLPARSFVTLISR
jgi:hypothetical protein